MPVARPPGAGKRWRRANTGYVHPPQTAPGLGPPRPWNGAWIQLSTERCRTNNTAELLPACSSIWWGPDRAGPPREGATLAASLFTSCDVCCLIALSCLVSLFANLFTSALASERGFHAFFLTRFQVKGVAFYLFNNVFLLHFALEAAQSVFKGFTLLQSNFRQRNTPPNPSGRTK